MILSGALSSGTLQQARARIEALRSVPIMRPEARPAGYLDAADLRRLSHDGLTMSREDGHTTRDPLVVLPVASGQAFADRTGLPIHGNDRSTGLCRLLVVAEVDDLDQYPAVDRDAVVVLQGVRPPDAEQAVAPTVLLAHDLPEVLWPAIVARLSQRNDGAS